MMQRASSSDSPARSATSSGFGSRPILLHELGRHRPHLAHRVDHVHRQANRAALVGDRPGDRLANPPGGVGRELVAALVFELVDRPHQARVAFLNQVQKAQAAVAVPLGDRDHQPQVGGREHALRLVVPLALFDRAGDEAGQRGRRFQRDPHQVAQLLHQLLVLPLADQFLRLRQLLLDRDHPLADLVKLLHDRHQLAQAADSALPPAARFCSAAPPAVARRRASRLVGRFLSIATRKSA